MPDAPQRIIFFHSGSIGDFLMYLFLAELLYRANPETRIRVVMPRNASFLRGFLGEYPYVTLLQASKWKPWPLLALLRRGGNRTVVIHPTAGRIPLRVKLLGWLLTLRGGTLVGFKDRGPLCGLYSKLLEFDAQKPYHETLIDIVRALGIESEPFAVRLSIKPDNEALESRGLRPDGYVVIHPGALTRERSFASDTVRALIETVRQKDPHCGIVLSGGAVDRTLLEEIKAKEPRVITALQLPAAAIAALLKNARLYVGVDTGISHLACFLGTRALVVAHEGTAVNWLPWYAPQATVLYRLRDESRVHEDLHYLRERPPAAKPFASVPKDAIVRATAAALA